MCLAEFWYPTKTADTHEEYGFPTKFKLRMSVFSPWDGVRLFPLFDDFGDLIAFSREYVTNDSLYPTEPYKVFIGHSLGGLMVINTLIQHPNLFNAYVAIDPSMWWANQKLLNTAKQVIASQKYAGKALFVGVANTMEPDMGTL